jgi:hypothetical protein
MQKHTYERLPCMEDDAVLWCTRSANSLNENTVCMLLRDSIGSSCWEYDIGKLDISTAGQQDIDGSLRLLGPRDHMV